MLRLTSGLFFMEVRIIWKKIASLPVASDIVTVGGRLGSIVVGLIGGQQRCTCHSKICAIRLINVSHEA